METVDVYRITDRLDDSTLEALVTRLESRGKHPRFTKMMDDYFDAMKIESAATVLDLGCGTGVAARRIARRTGFAGHITGIDVSPHLTAAAKHLASAEGFESVTEFRTGDSQALNLPDASFDAVVAHTLISHVQHPLAVLREIARVVKPEGVVGIFDGDYASLTFGSDDPLQGKIDDETIINAIVTNPRVMRQIPGLLRDAGFELSVSFSYVVADIGHADFWTSAIQSFRRLLPKAGAMTESVAQSWADTMFKRSEQGVFFGASNYYSFVARRH
ncbi:methyltransferase domain-containing protein [Variovorax sp. J22R115]|uniref:methyltransferase domain-containing protein n=1 Tax=Variovorax sp. J22R115 TaxID=3053509 RepID=UPI002577B9FB|nr:methyltransferase domain-containing protein [Variovorax sp. J22R115]MDM0049722.1 methyltransferase domain-containing protein [Variovorax sp. J22R115]